VLALAALAGAAGAFAPGSVSEAPAPVRHAPVAGAPVLGGALAVPPPVGLCSARYETRWAALRTAARARAAPGPRARVVARVAARTPDGTTNIVVATRRAERSGRLWVLVLLPGAAGWVPRAALGGYGVVRTRLVVHRRTLTATLLRSGRRVFESPVAIGRTGAPTPAGRFYVRDRLTRYASPAYGPIAFGTSATSPTLTDWPGGAFVGIHGTDRPDLIPGRVSHGCIRMRNADILRLARLMPVGTPITIT
jgi:lipoprotein-anchoring transpeptidase ErfK/SrfK